MDSPGFCATYCTYTIMEHETKDILVSIIMDKRQTKDGKSTSMEKEALVEGLRVIQDSGVIIKELVTDGSITIAAMMSKFYKNEYIKCYHLYFEKLYLRLCLVHKIV